MRCAVVDGSGAVINVIVANEADPAPEGMQLIALPDGLTVDQSCTWNGSEFVIPPGLPPVDPATKFR